MTVLLIKEETVPVSITVTGFHRFEKGEGIQKREENFAEEIAKLTKN